MSAAWLKTSVSIYVGKFILSQFFGDVRGAWYSHEAMFTAATLSFDVMHVVVEHNTEAFVEAFS